MSMLVGVDLDEDFRPRRNELNNFGQSRELMRKGVSPSDGDDLHEIRNAYTGIDTGVQTQDMAMVETMGPISDRTKEHLGASDAGIVHWRECIVRAVKAFLAGGTPPALEPPVAYHKVGATGALVPKGTDWRTVAWSATDDARLTAPATS